MIKNKLGNEILLDSFGYLKSMTDWDENVARQLAIAHAPDDTPLLPNTTKQQPSTGFRIIIWVCNVVW